LGGGGFFLKTQIPPFITFNFQKMGVSSLADGYDQIYLCPLFYKKGAFF